MLCPYIAGSGWIKESCWADFIYYTEGVVIHTRLWVVQGGETRRRSGGRRSAWGIPLGDRNRSNAPGEPRRQQGQQQQQQQQQLRQQQRQSSGAGAGSGNGLMASSGAVSGGGGACGGGAAHVRGEGSSMDQQLSKRPRPTRPLPFSPCPPPLLPSSLPIHAAAGIHSMKPHDVILTSCPTWSLSNFNSSL